ncbi:HlyD family efflux transporter periplasmic adaptor subunit [bacterium SCSIO 12643]|nr:HlyD family efflux transporter periplasmic adaptor subunit [bacterium SCSIO 12643]
MLNISKNKVHQNISSEEYDALYKVESKRSSKVFRRVILGFSLLILVIVFLPWTQNIRAKGYVTTLRPDQKPQSLTSVIAGRIDQWFVQEGDFVSKGDTILKISEVKDAYFDEELVERTESQVNLKKESIENYIEKIKIQNNQIEVLKELRDVKYKQAQNKLEQAYLKAENDSANYEAVKINYVIAQNQFDRVDSLYSQGLKSRVDWEQKKVKLQQTEAYKLSAKNKWLNAKNEIANLKMELSNIWIKFTNDLNKLESEKISTISQKLDVETQLRKLENMYSNYVFRNGLYYITAPQSGYITKTMSFGIGEVIKEGQVILSLMPKNYDLAVELYVDPINLPLMQLNEKVRIQFDGWPAIVFSGWPNVSYGTYEGEIYAIDQFISANGKYRILVKPNEESYDWPEALRFGSGTTNLIMLNDVAIWYELWRNINGFPPEYYTNKIETSQNKK